MIDDITSARRFGDDFLPTIAEVNLPTESLWAAGTSPSTGAFGLAESALQAALAEGAQSVLEGSGPTAESAGPEILLDPDSSLATLLKRRDAASVGSEHTD